MKNRKINEESFLGINACLKNILTVLIVIAGLFSYNSSQAQINFSVNIGSQPLWGPVNYDYVEYYYLPEVDVYYHVPTRQFIYLNGSNWVFVSNLPPSNRVDLFTTYKVVVNRPKPYLNHRLYVTKYGKYKAVHGRQIVIRDSPSKKYYVVKGHPQPVKVKAIKPKGAKGKGKKS